VHLALHLPGGSIPGQDPFSSGLAQVITGALEQAGAEVVNVHYDDSMLHHDRSRFEASVRREVRGALAFYRPDRLTVAAKSRGTHALSRILSVEPFDFPTDTRFIFLTPAWGSDESWDAARANTFPSLHLAGGADHQYHDPVRQAAVPGEIIEIPGADHGLEVDGDIVATLAAWTALPMGDHRRGAVTPTSLRTERLVLRRWRQEDRGPFADMNADPAVMEHFASTLVSAESDAFVDRIEAHFGQHGWGLWAVEVPGRRSFVGYVGLWPATFSAHFTPAVEIGWRLAHEASGHGYATEGARAVLADGFTRLGLDEIVSFAAVANVRSHRVMEKIGMRRDVADDFDHPGIVREGRGRPSVLYRLDRAAWVAPTT
jgi:RimJ/RimL family protein N-acetyltransferase